MILRSNIPDTGDTLHTCGNKKSHKRTHQVGDIVMSGPIPGEGTWFQKGIKLTGSIHTHDEIVCKVGGLLTVGNAHIPHFTLDPFQDRVTQADTGEIIAAVFRWTDFCGDKVNKKDYNLFKNHINACALSVALMKVPYDKYAILSHVRNWLRAKVRKFLPFLGFILNHVEYQFFCTESVMHFYRVAELLTDSLHFGMRAKTGNQPLIAPVHFEQLYKSGYLVLVEDYGLIKYLDEEKPQTKEAHNE